MDLIILISTIEEKDYDRMLHRTFMKKTIGDSLKSNFFSDKKTSDKNMTSNHLTHLHPSTICASDERSMDKPTC